MNAIDVAQLAAAVLGFVGTAILFLTGYSLQPLEGAVFGSDAVERENQRIQARNIRRMLWQRSGFAFLCVSFFVQTAAIIL